MIAFPLVGSQIVAVNFFQSLGMARKAIILSLTRQLIFLIPSLYILPMFLGLDGVWLSMPLADIVATSVSLVILYRQYLKFKQMHHAESK